MNLSPYTVIAAGSTVASTLADRFAREYWVEDFGAMTANGGGSANNSTIIQTALNYVGSTALGGRLRMQPLYYDTSVKLINTYNNVYIEGAGQGGISDAITDADTASTQLKWTGTAGGTMFDMGPVASGAQALNGGGIHGICFNGNSLAGTCVLIRGVHAATFALMATETTVVGIDITAEDTITPDNGGSRSNWFPHLVVVQTAVGSGIGMRWRGGTNANTSGNYFGFIKIQHRDSLGLDAGQSGANICSHCIIERHTAGTGIGVRLDSGVTPINARSNYFCSLQPGVGGLTVQGTVGATLGAIRHAVGFYNQENGCPLPVVEFGASLSYQTNTGTWRVSNDSAAANLEFHRATQTSTNNLGISSYIGYNASGVETVFATQKGQALDVTAGSEDGLHQFRTMVAGVDTDQFQIADGIKIGSPTGSFLGTESVNVGGFVYTDGAALSGIEDVTYSASMTPDQRLGRSHRIIATNATAFTINNPINSRAGDIVTIMIRNTSGGALGAITPGAGYRLGTAWPSPANGTNQTMQFLNDTGSRWVEISRTAGDVTN